jgi:hypothetical protein
MPPAIKQTLEITVTGEDDEYQVEARTDGNPTVPARLPWPPPGVNLERMLLQVREGFQLSDELLQDLGHALYGALMQDEVRRRLDQLAGREETFRVRLIIHAPELAPMPWELLHEGMGGAAGYLALRADYPLVRSIPTHHLATRGFIEDKIRVLFLGASPDDPRWPPLEVKAEENNLREALKELAEAGRVELIAHQDATLDDLRRGLDHKPHVIHFAGHGTFDLDADTGGLVLVGEGGEGHLLTGEELAVLLGNVRNKVQLVLLAACRTAEADVDRPYAGVAQWVMQAASLPAIVAMQFPIGDASAVAFSRELYQSLAAEYPVDVAVTRARQAVWLARRPNMLADWATPVLYMLGDQGHLWEGTMTDEEKREKDEAQTNDVSGFRINVGGDVKGDMKIAGRDIVEGDQVAGDKITVGDISGSKGIAIGRGASAVVTEGRDTAALEQVFADIVARLDALQDVDKQDIADAKLNVEEIKVEAMKGEEADEGFLAARLRNIARMGPDILDVVTASLISPAAGIAEALRKVAQKAREDRGLAPVG